MRRKNKNQLSLDFKPKFSLTASPDEIVLCKVRGLALFEGNRGADGKMRLARVGQHARCWRGEQP